MIQASHSEVHYLYTTRPLPVCWTTARYGQWTVFTQRPWSKNYQFSSSAEHQRSVTWCSVDHPWPAWQFVTKQNREVKQSLLHCTLWRALAHIFVQRLVFLAQVLYTVKLQSVLPAHYLSCRVFTCSAYMIIPLNSVCMLLCTKNCA